MVSVGLNTVVSTRIRCPSLAPLPAAIFTIRSGPQLNTIRLQISEIQRWPPTQNSKEALTFKSSRFR